MPGAFLPLISRSEAGMTNPPKASTGSGNRHESCGLQNDRATQAVCMALALASVVLLIRAINLW